MMEKSIFEKAVVFIDGGYLRDILRNNFNHSFIDYLKFCQIICQDLGLDRLRTYYYTCLPFVRKNNSNDMWKLSKSDKFISKLKRLPRFEVKLGKLQLIGGGFKQKMVDVLMSLDIVEMCFDKKINEVIIVAGDADFVPAIKKAKNCGAIVHLFYHSKSVHNELLDNVDEIHEINDKLINSCLREK